MISRRWMNSRRQVRHCEQCRARATNPTKGDVRMQGRRCAPRRARATRLLTRDARAAARAGFTLIEVLVALFILLLGIGAVMYLFPASLSAAREAAERTRTSQTAHSVISQIRASTAESLYNERLLPALLTQERSGANLYGYSTSIQRLAGAREVYLQRVTFAVTLGNGNTETFTTFVAQQ